MTRKFEVIAWEKITVTVEVEAENEEEAREIAEEVICEADVERTSQGIYAWIVNEAGEKDPPRDS